MTYVPVVCVRVCFWSSPTPRVLQIMFEHGEEVLITEDARVLT